MADDVARAIGAGLPEEIIIAGKSCRIRPLSIRELTELERDCLARYRRSYLQTYSENLDLLGNGDRQALMRSKFDEAARWDISDLPTKFVYDPKRLEVTPELVVWLQRNLDYSDVQADGTQFPEAVKELVRCRTTAVALDSGLLSEEEYEELTGKRPRKATVGYVNWWTTGCFDGMISMAWGCFKDCGVTRDEVAFELGRNPTLNANLTREIEHLSSPSVGNG